MSLVLFLLQEIGEELSTEEERGGGLPVSMRECKKCVTSVTNNSALCGKMSNSVAMHSAGKRLCHYALFALFWFYDEGMRAEAKQSRKTWQLLRMARCIFRHPADN